MFYGHSGSDRRRFQRMRMNLTVVYRVDKPMTVRILIGDKEIEAVTVDLSEGGMAILTDYDIPVGTDLVIKFTLCKVDKEGKITFYGPMVIAGDVRSNVLSEEKKGEHRLGIRFAQMNEKDKLELIGYLKSIRGL
jgi:c-di-GMP-binding flagellar brake protein YcgR